MEVHRKAISMKFWKRVVRRNFLRIDLIFCFVLYQDKMKGKKLDKVRF